MKFPAVAILGVLFITSQVRADDWPQFRGPDRSGLSKEKGLLKQWPKDGPKLAWTYKDAGLGFSSVAVAKGVVYTLGTDMKFEAEYVIAIDEAKGTELWRAKIGPVFTFEQNIWGDGPRSTPTFDGHLLFALSGAGELVCVDVAQKGKEVWRKNLVKDFDGGMMTKWGFSESPLVDGDIVICTPGGAGGTLLALNKTTGATVWRSKGWTDLAPYSSPVVADIHGKRQYIQIGFAGAATGAFLAGVDAKTGTVLWKNNIVPGDSYAISPTPVVRGTRVYATTSDASHSFEIDVKQTAEEKFKKANWKKLKNRDGGVVLVGDHIYGHSEPGMWVCQDFKTGDQAWAERNDFKCDSGSIIAADGMLYLYTDEGKVGLADADSKGFNLVSQFKIPEMSKIQPNRQTSKDSRTWTNPAIANGHLYLRDHEFIFAYKIK